MTTTQKKILILYYSFSGQTNSLLRGLEQNIADKGIEVVRERITTVHQVKFPLNGFLPCILMMIKTFFRHRIPIEQISEQSRKDFDLIILAGPTWSYNPSGPILSLLDRDGRNLFQGKTVIPLISCRGYWRMHWFGLRRLLTKYGAKTPNFMVFSHPNKEPWRTIGVFLKISGKTPERLSLLRKYYTKFGHTREQQQEAEHFGALIGDALNKGTPLETLHFRTPKALP